MPLKASTSAAISRVSAAGARSRQSRSAITVPATAATRAIGSTMRARTRPKTTSAGPSEAAMTSAWIAA